MGTSKRCFVNVKKVLPQCYQAIINCLSSSYLPPPGWKGHSGPRKDGEWGFRIWTGGGVHGGGLAGVIEDVYMPSLRHRNRKSDRSRGDSKFGNLKANLMQFKDTK